MVHEGAHAGVTVHGIITVRSRGSGRLAGVRLLLVRWDLAGMSAFVPLRARATLHAQRLGHPLAGTCSMTLDQFDFSWVATSTNAAASRARRVVGWSYGVTDAT
jgi:hypothetical protein